MYFSKALVCLQRPRDAAGVPTSFENHPLHPSQGRDPAPYTPPEGGRMPWYAKGATSSTVHATAHFYPPREYMQEQVLIARERSRRLPRGLTANAAAHQVGDTSTWTGGEGTAVADRAAEAAAGSTKRKRDEEALREEWCQLHEGMREQRKELVGRRVLVPRDLWGSKYECTEQDGKGWEAEIRELGGGLGREHGSETRWVVVRFLNARNEQGLPWADQTLALSAVVML